MPDAFVPQDWAAGVNAAFPVAPLGSSNSHGNMWWSTAVETVVSVADTPVKALGTTTFRADVAQDFDMPANNRLRYLGRQVSHFLVTVALSMTSASNIQTLGLYLAKNDTVIPSTEIKRKVGTGSDIGAVSVVTLIEMGQNDYVELWVANELTTGNVTIELADFIITEVG